MDFAKRKTMSTFAVQQLSNTLPHRMIVNASFFKNSLSYRLSAKVSGFFVVNSSIDFAKRKTMLTFAVQQLSNTLPH